MDLNTWLSASTLILSKFWHLLTSVRFFGFTMASVLIFIVVEACVNVLVFGDD